MKRYMGIPLVISMLLSMPACSEEVTDQKKVKQPGKEMTTKRVSLPSKLQYEIITESKDSQAKSATRGTVVSVHYTGWLADQDGNPIPAKKFDSSVDRGTPFQFIIGGGQVIRGWDEGVMGMKVGEKRRLIIPAELGYGTRGAGAAIPPNATLVFDVELLNVK